MKMIVTTLPDADNQMVSEALTSHGYRVTTISSTGGFLSSGTSTLMIGVQDDQVEDAIQMIKSNCTPSIEAGLKRGSLFVINVARFEQL